MQVIAKRMATSSAGMAMLIAAGVAASTVSATALAQTALSPPTGVIATTNSATGGVEVIWDSVPGANLYEILRGSGGGQSGPTPIGVVTRPSFNDNSAGSSEGQFYVVRALQGDLESELSEPANLTRGPVTGTGNPIIRINDGVIAADGTVELRMLNGNVITIDSDTVEALIFAMTEQSEEWIERKLRAVLGNAGPNLVAVTAAACLLIPENTYLVTDAALAIDSEEGLLGAAECIDIAPASGEIPQPTFELQDPVSATAELPSQLTASPTQ